MGWLSLISSSDKKDIITLIELKYGLPGGDRDTQILVLEIPKWIQT
jgi:hypothetical protein